MSNQIKISFPDSSVKEYKSGISSIEIAKGISNSLAKKILVASFNDVHIDLSTELTENGSIKFFTWDDIEGKRLSGTHRLTYLPKQLNHFIQVLNLE